MQTATVVVLIYGAVVLIGGVMGWIKARSKPSLISGVVLGGALIFTGFFINRPAGLWTALALTAVLTILMGGRFIRSKKFMPAGMIALLSLAVLIALLALR
jgi:uncharacterized membrane protein (UPF0136 family)